MPYLITLIGGAIKYLAAYLVARIMFTLGVSAVVYIGIDAVIDQAKAEMSANLSNLGPLLDIFVMMGVPQAFSIIFSAISIRMLLNGSVAGSIAAYRISQG